MNAKLLQAVNEQMHRTYTACDTDWSQINDRQWVGVYSQDQTGAPFVVLLTKPVGLATQVQIFCAATPVSQFAVAPNEAGELEVVHANYPARRAA